jgi:hypothetical protein
MTQPDTQPQCKPMRPLSTRLRTFFQETATRVARETQFVQRLSKVTGAVFAQTWIMGFVHAPQASLGQLTETAGELGVDISEQGLDQRLSTKTVHFFKQLLAEALAVFRNELSLELPVLEQFTAILLQDSTVLALPASLQAEFPGCGGDGPAATAKVQLLFELRRGNLEAVAWQAGRAADQAYAGHLEHLPAGALLLNDLGYFGLQQFRRVAEKKATLSAALTPRRRSMTHRAKCAWICGRSYGASADPILSRPS